MVGRMHNSWMAGPALTVPVCNAQTELVYLVPVYKVYTCVVRLVQCTLDAA